MRTDNNFDGNPNYYPNSFGGQEPHPDTDEPAFEVSGQAARHPYRHPNDDFFQPGELFRRVMNDRDRDNLIDNIINHLGKAQSRIQLRQTALFYKADPDYGRRVADGLKLDVAEVRKVADMSQAERVKATAK
jgi:catalase